jgi:hypothetical protein
MKRGTMIMPNGYDLVDHMARHIGQTVTIFTTSGGESGRGFTGVLAMVNNRFIRLITNIGPAPGCALGSCCDKRRDRHCGDEDFVEGVRDRDRFDCFGRDFGSVVDIPVDRIAAFVHNSVGSSW